MMIVDVYGDEQQSVDKNTKAKLKTSPITDIALVVRTYVLWGYFEK